MCSLSLFIASISAGHFSIRFWKPHQYKAITHMISSGSSPLWPPAVYRPVWGVVTTAPLYLHRLRSHAGLAIQAWVLLTQLTHMFGWCMVHAWKFHGIIWILNMNHAWNTHEKSMDHGMTSQSHDRNHHIGQVCSHQRLWIRILTSPATCWIAVYSM